MDEKLSMSLKELGSFLNERRKQMGRTVNELADFLSITPKDVIAIENGSYKLSLELYLKIAQSLECKSILAPLEIVNKGTFPVNELQESFLPCVNKSTSQLFILHRKYPACLMEVIQSTPMTFRIVDLYDKDIDEDQLLVHPFIEQAKEYARKLYSGSF